jgi:hypothetical protein
MNLNLGSFLGRLQSSLDASGGAVPPSARVLTNASNFICGPHDLFEGIIRKSTKNEPKTTPETQGIYLGALVLLRAL